MAASPAIFSDLIGQPGAARFLTAVISQNRSSHAYLFLGPAGVGKNAAARRLAAALCCEQNGCGQCLTCRKARRGAHPDIQVIAPAGSIIMVDQIRELNRALSLRPSESRARVFIFPDAGAFNAASANAFLKSLEEPPSFVCFILLATSEDRLLATLVSRCQPVRFGPVPAPVIEAHLAENCEVRPAEAQAFARIAGGNLDLAVRLCRDQDLARRRRRYIQIGENLVKGAREGGAAQIVAEIAAAAREAAQKATLEFTHPAVGTEHVPEGFCTISKKRLEEDARRRANAAARQEIDFALGVLQSWFRDMMVMAAGAGQAVLNRDFELELEDRALPSRLGSYQQAFQAIGAARGKLGYNIDVELALQAMVFDLQEVL
ncbi:MAG: DNA polymerase III subunit delta' [Thermoleophilia bacterium]|nr:DNA polymerase III subunit delta' [Thermoleophilia bacterium]